jgi:hypothetical protein
MGVDSTSSKAQLQYLAACYRFFKRQQACALGLCLYLYCKKVIQYAACQNNMTVKITRKSVKSNATCQNHNRACEHCTRACRDYTLRVKIILVLVKITLG